MGPTPLVGIDLNGINIMLGKEEHTLWSPAAWGYLTSRQPPAGFQRLETPSGKDLLSLPPTLVGRSVGLPRPRHSGDPHPVTDRYKGINTGTSWPKVGNPDRQSTLQTFGQQELVSWKTVFLWTLGGEWFAFRMIQVHYIYCALYFYYYYISSTSDHQALDPRG